MKLIGEILVENGLLTREDLETALSLQKGEEPRRQLGEVLISMGKINYTVLMQYLDLQLKQ